MRLRGSIENRNGRLFVGGMSVEELAAKHGTPLYIYDELFIRSQCKAIVGALAEYPGAANAYFASKAFPNAAVEKLIHEEGLGVDVASEGEMRVAMLAGVPFEKIMAHGAYKHDRYIELGVQNGVGRIVIDSIGEISRVEAIAKRLGKPVKALLRINPGVEAETHEAVQTANLNTKFGVPLINGLALSAVKELLSCSYIELMGIHCHVGSQVFKMDVFDVASDLLLRFMKEVNAAGASLTELNIGGGFGAYYKEGDSALEMAQCVRMITANVRKHCETLDLPLPALAIEPGRAIVAEAAVAVYTVGVVKEIPGVNNYLITDGGLFDNPRPLFYGSVYDAFLPSRMDDSPTHTYTVSGYCCETDTLIKKISLPRVSEGELLVMPTAGAYQATMAGNYQRTPKPAILLVKDGAARLIQRRQTFEEVLALDMP